MNKLTIEQLGDNNFRFSSKTTMIEIYQSLDDGHFYWNLYFNISKEDNIAMKKIGYNYEVSELDTEEKHFLNIGKQYSFLYGIWDILAIALFDIFKQSEDFFGLYHWLFETYHNENYEGKMDEDDLFDWVSENIIEKKLKEFFKVYQNTIKEEKNVLVFRND